VRALDPTVAAAIVRALVAVIGELGRSPRMLAHVGALLRAGYEVHLIGGTSAELPATLRNEARLHVHALDGDAARPGSGIAAVLKIIWRGLRLTWRLTRLMLWQAPRPDLVLIQNPPTLPTFGVALVVSRLRRARLIIDWHNLGWSVLGLRFGRSHPLVRAARWAEYALGRHADGHLVVSHRLATHLHEHGIADAIVLHDGPSAVRPFGRAGDSRPDDPLIIVAPMGWTRDDDLPLLADALRLLASHSARGAAPHRTIVLRVSGHGPLRSAWAAALRALTSDHVVVETPDVPTDGYPALLAASNIGLCVHRSASQLDLPMKVIELRAVGLPVLLLDDGSPLDEIAPMDSGVVRFTSADALAESVHRLLSEPALVAQLTAAARANPPRAWEDAWVSAMAPFVRRPT
jgi:beta-1,4-mannosyltransferase